MLLAARAAMEGITHSAMLCQMRDNNKCIHRASSSPGHTGWLRQLTALRSSGVFVTGKGQLWPGCHHQPNQLWRENRQIWRENHQIWRENRQIRRENGHFWWKEVTTFVTKFSRCPTWFVPLPLPPLMPHLSLNKWDYPFLSFCSHPVHSVLQ